jgi:hypothetical protein
MGKHLRRLFSAGEVKEIFERYLSQEIGVEQALGLLKIRRRQFFKFRIPDLSFIKTSSSEFCPLNTVIISKTKRI